MTNQSAGDRASRSIAVVGTLALSMLAAAAAALSFIQPSGERLLYPIDAVSFLMVSVFGLIVSLGVRRLRSQTDAARSARAEIERQLQQKDRLQRLTATLSQARTPSDLVGACLPELQRAIGATGGAALIVTEDGTGCELAHAVEYADRPVAAVRRFALEHGTLVGDAIHGRQLIVASRTGEPAKPGLTPFDGLPDLPEGTVVVPLLATGGAIGAIALTFPPSRTLDDSEREFLVSAGRNMGQALDRARLYEATERARAEAEALRVRADSELQERQKAEEALRLSEARYRALAARTSRLYALNAGLSEALTLEAVAKVSVEQAKVVVGASTGSVAALIDGGARFEVLFDEADPGHAAEARVRFPAEPGLSATAAVETRRPIFVRSFAEWQERFPKSASSAADGGFTSAAVLPLVRDRTVLGVLSLHFTVPVNFDDEYQAVLAAVAQHCAQALDRASLYEAAERARTEAEAANRSKDDFLSTISHELRTPLNAMLGWAAMLRAGSIDPGRTARAIESIYNNATRQGRLIEELLDVSRIVAGRATIDMQDIDLGQTLRGAVEAMMPLAAARHIGLRLERTPDTRVSADPRRLEQVFLNLLSNAVKFTPQGGRITADIASAGLSVDVRVTDTGDGIDPSFLPHVFERFRQADSTTTRGTGGLGLGLFIARQLMEAQGGTIRVESGGLGRGSTFIVTLPALPEERQSMPTPGPAVPEHSEELPALDGVTVLLVDDEPDATEMMASALERCGAAVITTSSAREALHALTRAPIDLVLSDIAMPDEDGYALIREIRALPSSRLAAIPAAAVTAHARDDERERALAAGFQAHLTKPIHPAELARVVASLACAAQNARGVRL